MDGEAWMVVEDKRVEGGRMGRGGVCEGVGRREVGGRG